eukprot:CAMPEP_0196744054 /NCGR_PEP_ID=MMETSP1091-20130531/55768_1 /TAXON_ID=302021 /ORGANISM="Rhodomonas sp., Strain CCMP768" /LENGTH=59 /DNA_ID=CAMNT_0042090529 /DNA_START=235 /DNA_END=411 /DNA_ORIENTATION=+
MTCLAHAVLFAHARGADHHHRPEPTVGTCLVPFARLRLVAHSPDAQRGPLKALARFAPL